ncbi:MAG: hypothetical protein KDA84_05030 [Planctomycetaceae bacterium]|nr:hypothetical protein [Planctomycetaceae bacterium]
MVGLLVVLLMGQTANAREQYFTELMRVLAGRSENDVAEIANRLKCRMCHTTEPAGKSINVFGQELSRVLGREKDVQDRRSIRMALHRAVFVLKNLESSGSTTGPAVGRTIRRRYVGSVLKEKSELAAYEMPLRDVLDVLSRNHEIAIEPDFREFKRAGISPELPISISVSDVPLQSMLKFLLAEHHLTYDIKNNAVIVRPLAANQKATSTRPVQRKTSDAPPPDLAKTLRSYIGMRIQVTEKDGTRSSETLLKLHESGDGKLEALSVFSLKSSSRKRYIDLSDVKEIRAFNQTLFSRPEEKDPVVLRSRQLEQEVLARERSNRRERLQTAYRRQAGLERVATSVREQNRGLNLNRQDAAELGQTDQVIEALAALATLQALQNRPDAANPPGAEPGAALSTMPPSQSPTKPPSASSPPQNVNQPMKPEIGRKTVVIQYRTAKGSPPSQRYGTRIRYESQDSDDPKVQQGDLDDQGQCQLEVPEDVKTIKVYTTPFGGSEGQHPLKPTGTTTVTIQIEGI